MRISDWSSDVCSSDLANESAGIIGIGGDAGAVAEQRAAGAARRRIDGNDADRPPSAPQLANERAEQRSEEHTSELQSLMRSSYAVFCLKKKTTHGPSQQTETPRAKKKASKHHQ